MLGGTSDTSRDGSGVPTGNQTLKPRLLLRHETSETLFLRSVSLHDSLAA